MHPVRFITRDGGGVKNRVVSIHYIPPRHLGNAVFLRPGGRRATVRLWADSTVDRTHLAGRVPSRPGR